jgi:hypothetical protein
MGSWITLTNEGMGLFTSYTHIRSENEGTFGPGENQQYRVTPKNYVGFGTVKGYVTAIADSYPTTMSEVTVTSITPTSVTLTWTNVSADADCGYDPVTFYSIEWDEGNDNWNSLNAEEGGFILTYTHTLGGSIFPANLNMNYKVRARNGVGYGQYYTVAVLADT